MKGKERKGRIESKIDSYFEGNHPPSREREREREIRMELKGKID